MLQVLIRESNAVHRHIYFRSAAAVDPVARVAAAAAIAVPNVRRPSSTADNPLEHTSLHDLSLFEDLWPIISSWLPDRMCS